jgi:glycosyltransferase involved in cell wall biosynthesis
VSVEFTVGIPTHNRRETVLLALASSLEQTRPPTRVYVVADGCADGTQEAVRALGDDRVEVLDRPKGFGCGYAHRNEVLERAGGGIVAWLADDDLWLPDHLERAGELFDADVAGIVNSMACLVREDGTLEPFGTHWRAPTYRDRFLGAENRTPSSAVSHQARAALAAGGWPTDVERAGDWDLWQRMVRGGAHSEMVVAPTVLFFSAWNRKQSWRDRVAQNAGFLARLRDPAELARLRGEMAFTCSARADADSAGLAESYEREARREDEIAEVRAERDRLAGDRDRLAGELEAITSGTWWRMRRPFEPALRMRRRLRRRGRRSER